jgi:hypothetical protein
MPKLKLTPQQRRLFIRAVKLRKAFEKIGMRFQWRATRVTYYEPKKGAGA